MGWDPANLTDRQWSMIDKKDRQGFGKRAKTHAEIQHEKTSHVERHIHDQFTSFCDRNGIDPWHSDPTRKSSIRTGYPDFLCVRDGRAIGIEFKVPPNKLSPVQEQRFADLRAHGTQVHVCEETSEGAAYTKATRIVSEFFNLVGQI